MNKIAIALSTLLSLGAISTASAQTGNINFTGEITATTCDISFPGGTGTGFDGTYVLPKVAATSLAAAGSTAGKTPITLRIGGAAAQCTTGIAALELNPSRTAVLDGSNLKNTLTTGNATNVAVGLRDANDNAIDIRIPWRSAEINLATTKDLTFAAEYVATGATTAGNVAAQVQYTVDYK